MAGADQRLAHPESRVAETMAVHLADKDDCKRQEARSALVRIGRPAVPVLVKALEHPQASVRRLAAETLGSIKPPAEDAVTALIVRLRDSNPQVRAACLETLRRIGGPREQVMDALASALGDADPYVREQAVWSLSYIGRDAKAAAPLLKKRKNDDHDEAVR
jgi:HEAT repeat protein